LDFQTQQERQVANEEKPRDPHLHDKKTGMILGVPAGAAQEEATGLPDSGRHQTETALHPEAGKDDKSP
jgi:hypothetical protein